jgi:hypothetical protein
MEAEKEGESENGLPSSWLMAINRLIWPIGLARLKGFNWKNVPMSPVPSHAKSPMPKPHAKTTC